MQSAINLGLLDAQYVKRGSHSLQKKDDHVGRHQHTTHDEQAPEDISDLTAANQWKEMDEFIAKVEH